MNHSDLESVEPSVCDDIYYEFNSRQDLCASCVDALNNISEWWSACGCMRAHVIIRPFRLVVVFDQILP